MPSCMMIAAVRTKQAGFGERARNSEKQRENILSVEKRCKITCDSTTESGTESQSRLVSRLVLSFGVAIALEASHGDGLKLERARRDASFKEVGDTPARPALSLQNGGRSRSRTEGYLSFEAPALL